MKKLKVVLNRGDLPRADSFRWKRVATVLKKDVPSVGRFFLTEKGKPEMVEATVFFLVTLRDQLT